MTVAENILNRNIAHLDDRENALDVGELSGTYKAYRTLASGAGLV